MCPLAGQNKVRRLVISRGKTIEMEKIRKKQKLKEELCVEQQRIIDTVLLMHFFFLCKIYVHMDSVFPGKTWMSKKNFHMILHITLLLSFRGYVTKNKQIELVSLSTE